MERAPREGRADEHPRSVCARSRGRSQGPEGRREMDPRLVRELRHPPATVWQALTDPAQLSEWAPFDADRNLARWAGEAQDGRGRRHRRSPRPR
jgi:hypothetical protein